MFDSYWHDATFEAYDPARDRDRLDDALAEASGRRTHDRVTLSLSGLEVRPYPHQTEMLEQLDVERVVHDRHRNLVVAATGTGKTVVAALDYRRLCEQLGDRPTLLFIAHRREILEQSLRTYREVLNEADFGELYVGGARPERWRPSSHRSSRSRHTASATCPRTPSPSWSSTSSTTPRPAPTAPPSTDFTRLSSWA
ncbi:DEAD/DEAH box helicase family protein [Terrabacter sp. BE26]|uniref:DEAD/DEAH box helicase family protein n=1 Tax=Terrabacter sp. BE26 TaxID=2898152 RepID=UPI0035BE9DDB